MCVYLCVCTQIQHKYKTYVYTKKYVCVFVCVRSRERPF